MAKRARFKLLRSPEDVVLNFTEFVVEQGSTVNSVVTMGRTHTPNGLTLPHRQISREHLKFFWDGGHISVEDPGSRNGTYVMPGTNMQDDELDELLLQPPEFDRLTPNVPQKLQVSDIVLAGPFAFQLVEVEDTFVSQEGIPPNGVTELNGHPIEDLDRIKWEIIERNRKSGDIPSVPLRQYQHMQGIPTERSTWLNYLPAIYGDDLYDPTGFVGRYLLIFEEILSPIIWTVDNLDMFLSAETAPEDWLQWIASWFDVDLFSTLSIERQREIVGQMGWLFMRRGTKAGLAKMLYLFFDVQAEIVEDFEKCHFDVNLRVDNAESLDEQLAHYIIATQKPAFTTYNLYISVDADPA